MGVGRCPDPCRRRDARILNPLLPRLDSVQDSGRPLRAVTRSTGDARHAMDPRDDRTSIGTRSWLVRLLFWSGKPTRPVVLAILLATVSPIALMATMSYWKTHRDLTDLVLSRRQALVYLAASTLKADFDRLKDIAISLATRVRFRQLIGEGRWDEAVQILEAVPKDFPFIDRVFLADPSGTLMADSPALPLVRGRNFSHRDWYQGVLRSWEPYVSEVYRRAAEPRINVFAVAVPIRSEDSRVVGILVLQIRVSVLLAWTRDVDTGPGGLLYLVDRKGHLAVHPRHDPDGEILDYSGVEAVRKALRGVRRIEILRSQEDAQEHVYSYQPVPGYGWAVISAQPAETAFATRAKTLRNMLFAYGLLVLFSALLAYAILRALIEKQHAEDHIRRLNEELDGRAAELDAANRELEAFSYSVSHDLRAPLRYISGFTDLLERHASSTLDEKGRRYLTTISRSAKQMGTLIDDLLEFSRMGRVDMQETSVSLSHLIEEVRAELAEEAGGRHIEWKIGPLPAVRGDRAMLRLALCNLISNALKYTRPKSKTRIEIGADTRDSEVVVFVRDNGVGFESEYAHKLFGVFQRLHRAEEFEGTGVGLANVRRIICRHGGETWAESEPGQGATFYFSLPGRGDVA